jgi:hypothetical protein
MQQPSGSIPDDDHPRQNPLDEPPWSPALIEAIQGAETCYIVASQVEADLLSRHADLAPLWVLPYESISDVPLDMIKPISRLCVLSPGGVLDHVYADAFYWHLQEIAYPHQYTVLPLDAKTLWQRELDAADTRKAWRRRLQEQREPSDHLPEIDPAAEFKKKVIDLLMGKVKAWRPSTASKAMRPGARTERPVIVHADQVQAQPIPWLWEPYIPRGMLVMLDGDPGLGKTLMLLQVAANLSKQQPFLDQLGKPTLVPDVDGPQTTLILSAEDSLPHVMIPRLKRAGADLTRIKFLTGRLGSEDEEHAFDLQHLPVLIQALRDWRPVLVILDPLVAYLGPIDMHRSNETRPLTAALKQVAEQHACTVMGVRHPAKLDQGGRLMYRGQGNIDLIGAARSGLWVQQHPAHPETQSLMIHAKTNIGTLGRTIVFSRERGEFSWKGISRLTEAMMTGRGPDPHALLEAFFWLEEYMTAGVPYDSTVIEKEALKLDISTNTLKRAKKFLGVASRKDGEIWRWILPPLSTTKAA